ncbi:MAG: LacI family transcriptional regulator [Butyrivibrio sp.]|jgi:DNA-binding LacI/PurR family transcriptional regulator|nr:LacI family transcriptional regulator [Butyrivibrio sp.]
MPKEIGISEIAKELNISATTVSRALSGKGRVGEETKEKILQYIGEHDYVPHVRPEGYAQKNTRNICVTLPGENDFAELPYFHQIMLSIEDYFGSHDYNIIPVKCKATDISLLQKVIQKHKADGVILTRTIENGIDIRYLQEQGVPFVVVGSYDDDSVYQVDVDQQNGCRELTNILLRKGLRKIALFCADATHIVTQSRYRGFLEACQENDLAVNKKYVFDEVGYPEVAARALEDCLKDQIECIICMDDNICVNVLNQLRAENVAVPRDIRIASYYNSSILDIYYPPITALEFNTKELGRVASKMLYDLLCNKEPVRKQKLGYQVILKESTK